MKQVFHNYLVCEEFHPDNGMWRRAPVVEVEGHTERAEELMCDPERFEAAMRRVLVEWPHSAEAALTDPTINQKAWLGHAGCFLGVGSPEACTRSGWWRLDAGEQSAANAAAGRVIDAWHAQQRGMTPEQLPMEWEEVAPHA